MDFSTVYLHVLLSYLTQIDKEELEDVRWFFRSEVAQMLARQHPDGIFVPPEEAIAHQLIKAWISSNIANL